MESVNPQLMGKFKKIWSHPSLYSAQEESKPPATGTNAHKGMKGDMEDRSSQVRENNPSGPLVSVP